jgi:hypothetical protein
MTKKTLAALKKSIKHWEDNLKKAKAGEGFSFWGSDCALCELTGRRSEMKALINKIGNLFIERAGILKEQLCKPIEGMSGPDGTSYNQGVPCGDWCPHFGEPVIAKRINPGDYWPEGIPAHLPDRISLCHGTVLIGEIVDERGKP